jgi:hypothetical protein
MVFVRHKPRETAVLPCACVLCAWAVVGVVLAWRLGFVAAAERFRIGCVLGFLRGGVLLLSVLWAVVLILNWVGCV